MAADDVTIGSGTKTRGQFPPTGSPHYSKTVLGSGLVFEEYGSSGIVEIPEAENPFHVLILRTGSPSLIEWRSSGRDHSVHLEPGTVSLLPAGLRMAARVSRPMPGEASILHINPTLFARNIKEMARGGGVELIRRMDLQDPQICRLMKTLRADVATGSFAGSIFGESVAAALSVYVAQRYSTLQRPLESWRGGLSRTRLKRVVDYINSNLDSDLALHSLAEVADLNVYHFAKAFKHSVGESPHQFVLRTRIERAKEFLLQPRVSVMEASARTGFVDQSHFSKVFRRIVGVAPSEYRSNT